MRRFVLSLVLLFALACGTALAGEGTVVAFERGSVTVKVGEKEQKIELRGVKVFDAEGKEIPGRMRREHLKKDTKVEITEKDGKVTEIKIKK
jgi:hypothetical protein